jgi:hypothetical protein
MISVPEEVERVIRQSPFLEEALADGILNLSALARKIKPEIEQKLYKNVTEGSIVMALKRLSLKKDLKKEFDLKKSVGNLIVRSNLVELTYKNSHQLIEGLKKVMDKIKKIENDIFFNFSRGTFETTIVCSNNIASFIKKILSGEQLVSAFEKISSISINLNYQTVDTPGVYYTILKILSWNGINITEVVSTYREFTILVEEKDIDKAFTALKRSL